MSVPMPDLPDLCWPVDTSTCDCDWQTITQPIRERAEAMAVRALRALTGYRVGGCPVTIRPCTPAVLGTYISAPVGGSMWTPILVRGAWRNLVCGTDSCGCRSASVVHLPSPVGPVSEVYLNGSLLTPDVDYRVQGNALIRVNGSWPRVQDVYAPLDADGTFGVTYLNAFPVDGLGAAAAGALACEFAKAMQNQDCLLPPGVVGVVRQGVSYEFATGAFPGGFTGVQIVDQFIHHYNPNGLVGASLVYSPDL